MIHVSERAVILAPHGRDAQIAATILAEAGIESCLATGIPDLVEAMNGGVGFGLLTEEALRTADLRALSAWIEDQAEWSDLPFVLLTQRGGGLERNPAAGRHLETLGNVTFLERPFHPTTLISLAKSALRGRRRQYEARARLEKLRESDRQFQSLANSIPNLCWMAEPDGNIFWYNQRCYEYTGTSPEQMTGWGWQSVHDPELLPGVIERWRASLDTGQPFEMIFPLKSATGEFRPFLTRVEPLRDAGGGIVRWFGTNTDISAQQAAEEGLRHAAAELERRVEERTAEHAAAMAQLHEAQKLETLGQLTGGVAHDFNNLLTPITGTLDLLQRRFGESDARAARLIANALQAADRAKTLVQRLLGFARRQTLETKPTDVSELLAGMRDLIASSIGPAIELRLQDDRALPPAMADPNQLELAILNLCVNARDAMPDGGTLTLVAEKVAIGPRSEPKLAPGLYVRLSVIDDGSGMDAQTLARAIEPFYSTKETGRGTGLGLSMVHGLAGQLGGGFALTSEVGEGTRADLYLPAAENSVVRDRVSRQGPLPAVNRTLSILLVDDEEVVREATAEMIRDLGHHVVAASGGEQALARLAAGLDPDLVITDYKMPRMDGAELARRLREQAPELPVLLITGYTGTTEDTLHLPRLSKPFGQTEMANALAELLSPDPKVVRLPVGGKRPSR
ncbi:MAG TPA: response regulator [Allosphingosinicella sp.]